ncbi:hypothetical protein OQA88_12441 [Cercophora sp. LCS_1]
MAVLLLASLLPGVAYALNPLLPRATAPPATPTSALTPNLCMSAFEIVYSEAPAIETYPAEMVDWFDAALQSRVTTMPPNSLCEINELAKTLSAPDEVRDAYSKYISDITEWQSDNWSKVHSMASASCKGDIEAQAGLEGMVMTDRKDCERWRSKYMGRGGGYEETWSDVESEASATSDSQSGTATLTGSLTGTVATGAAVTTTGAANAGSKVIGMAGVVVGGMMGALAAL